MNRGATEALAWALIYFIGQGALIALLAGLLNSALRRARPTTRYAIFCAALLLMAAAPVVTFLALYADGPPAPIAELRVPGAAGGTDAAVVASVAAPSTPVWFIWLVRLWLAGVAMLSIRSFGGWILAQRLKHWKTTPAAESLHRTASRLRARLAIRRVVRIYQSAVAEVPSAIGWLRPVILLPATAITGLTPEQMELLLAHELAHIRRYDYLVNLVQTAIETVLFYHPAVWWVSSQIRNEREHCCDDLAVQACGDALAYAQTLARLEGLRGARPEMVMAADGGSLLARIQRLLHRDGSRRYTPPAWVGALLPVAVVLIAVFSVRPEPVRATAPEADPVQPRPAYHGEGFLAGLTDAGYTKISVDEIIALKQHGVQPGFIKQMLSAGLGTPTVEQMIKLREQGVDPTFAAQVAHSGLVKNLDVETVIHLRHSGVNPEDMSRIRGLGFGPYSAEDIVQLKNHGATAGTFEALKEAGVQQAGVADAVELQRHGVTADSIRSMKSQGFSGLTLEQIIKLKRAGII